MLEILVLFLVGRHVATIAKRKNRNPVGYVLLLVGSYFGGAISFGIMGLIVGGAADADENEALLIFLMGYLVGAALGVGLAYLIVGSVPPRPRDTEYDDYDDYDRPRRQREYYDDDHYDRPRSRRRDDDYYDDDRPRRRVRDDYE